MSQDTVAITGTVTKVMEDENAVEIQTPNGTVFRVDGSKVIEVGEWDPLLEFVRAYEQRFGSLRHLHARLLTSKGRVPA